MTPLVYFTAYCASVAVALYFGHRWGRATAPNAQTVTALRQALAVNATQFEEAWEARYDSGYERGRVDQAELETDKRRVAGKKAGQTRRQRTNRVTGETKPAAVLATTDEGAE